MLSTIFRKAQNKTREDPAKLERFDGMGGG